ncbi:uncharacterized protein LOC108874507 [Lates calcarifer]|uniref:Uncharacterized protein LOC108874507 n=1 Tax=Lates calcarifer TaxID=8187 RepID=A0AAJ8DMR8_LATCA|nr:uncharacterized protein LOC108874507 [Lates calcarifer]
MDDPENSSSDVSTGDKKHLDPLTEPQTTEDTQQSSSADGTDPQAADSETQKSSQFSNSDEEKPSQEDLKVSQLSPSPPQSDTTEAKIPANMKPEELTARLQELQGLIPEDCMKAAERLVKDYDTKIPGDSEHLSQFFTCLKDFMESNQKSDKGDKKHLDPLTEPQTTEDTQQSSSADGTDPQAADSETQKSSQFSNSDEEKPSQEDLKVSQLSPSPPQSDTTEAKIPANMKPEELTARLQELQGLIPEDCMKAAERLVKDYDTKIPGDSEHLSQFFTCLKDFMESNQKSDKGDKKHLDPLTEPQTTEDTQQSSSADGTDPQAADSETQKSSQFSNSDEEKPSQEDLKVSQLSPSPPQSDTTEAKIPANMKPEELTARLQELQGLIPEDCMKAAERLVKDYDTKIPGDSEHLSQFFTCLKDFMESNQKSDKGDKKHLDPLTEPQTTEDTQQSSSADGTDPQAADSETQKSSQFSNSDEEKPSQEDLKVSQLSPSPPQSDTTEAKIPANMKPEELTARLQELQGLIPEDCMKAAERLVKDYDTKIPGDSEHLSQFFTCLKDFMESNQKSDKGDKKHLDPLTEPQTTEDTQQSSSADGTDPQAADSETQKSSQFSNSDEEKPSQEDLKVSQLSPSPPQSDTTEAKIPANMKPEELTARLQELQGLIPEDCMKAAERLVKDYDTKIPGDSEHLSQFFTCLKDFMESNQKSDKGDKKHLDPLTEPQTTEDTQQSSSADGTDPQAADSETQKSSQFSNSDEEKPSQEDLKVSQLSPSPPQSDTTEAKIPANMKPEELTARLQELQGLIPEDCMKAAERLVKDYDTKIPGDSEHLSQFFTCLKDFMESNQKSDKGDKKHLDPLTEPQTTEDTQQSSSADGTDPQAADSETQRSSQGDSQDSGQKTKGILKSLFSWLLPKSSRHVNRSDDAQEAADSETQRSSQGDSQNSGQKSSQFSNSDEEKPSQEDLKVSQLSPSPPQSDTTEAKIPANMKPEELTARLQELQGLIPEDCMKAAERLVKDYDTKIPGDSEHLSQFFTCLKDFMESNQKSDKGKKHKRTHLEKSGKPNQQVKNRALWYPVTVKVFCEVTGQTFGAHETILQQVKKKGLTSTQVKITTDLQECDVIIVFCPIVSRAGSDVKAATRNMSGSKPIILVLMHHTRKPDHSTGGKMWSETFPGIVLEVNVLYHETESGLLTCSENDKAIKKIRKELKKHQVLRL